MAEHPPEQERARERRALLIIQDIDAVEAEMKGHLSVHQRECRGVAKDYLALLAAYEDRSAAFERAAAECVRLEGENERLGAYIANRYETVQQFFAGDIGVNALADAFSRSAFPAEAKDGACHGRCGEEYANFNCPRCRALAATPKPVVEEESA